VIEVEGLSKTFGGNPRPAVSRLSFNIAKGNIVGFLGPNGAGKSTTMRILAGVLAPSSGTARIAGHSVVTAAEDVRRVIGYMPEGVPLHLDMRVVEYLRFRAEVKLVERSRVRANIDDAMARANVTDVANASIGTLSKGYRQRVGLADALVAKPQVLILDEPTAGLDPNQIRDVRKVLRALAGDCTVLLSTHILSEVEATCNEAIVIDHGTLIASGPLSEIRAKHAASELFVRVALAKGTSWDALGRTLGAIAGVASVRKTEQSENEVCCEIALKDAAVLNDATEEVAQCLVTASHRVRELRPGRTSLEDVFSRLTREAETEDATTASERSPRADQKAKKGASS
jgi:ABC-2 type transport system ATP-binding protein